MAEFLAGMRGALDGFVSNPVIGPIVGLGVIVEVCGLLGALVFTL